MATGSPGYTVEGNGLRACFFWQGDRWAHRVEQADAARPADWTARWQSHEGTESDLWPPSPALQQAHWGGDAERPALLMVGMAGRSHWSLCCAAAADGNGIEFDVACRHEGEPHWLGSQYLAIGAGAGWLGAPLLAPEAGGELDLRITPIRGCGVQAPIDAAAAGSLWTIAAQATAGTGRRTTRWCYRMLLGGDPSEILDSIVHL